MVLGPCCPDHHMSGLRLSGSHRTRTHLSPRKMAESAGEQRDRRRKDFDALVEKIQSAKDRDKSALMIELNSLP